MNSASAFLRQYLADRDVPCPLCGYNLRDLVGDRCPECGDRLTLQVNPVEPRQAAAIAGLILLAAGGGLNGLLLIYWAVVLMNRQMMGPVVDEFFYVNSGGLIVEGIAISVWISQWKKIRRLPTLSRWALAICFCGFLTVADLIVFTKYIR